MRSVAPVIGPEKRRLRLIVACPINRTLRGRVLFLLLLFNRVADESVRLLFEPTLTAYVRS